MKQIEVHALNSFQFRLIIALLLVFVLLGALGVRMMWLQITHHDAYKELADGNRIRMEPITPVRGRILDRNGIVVADNQTVYTLELNRDELPRSQRNFAAVSEQVKQIQYRLTPSLDLRSIDRMGQQWRRMNRHLPFTIARISEEDAAKFASVTWQYPGFMINAIPQRIYPYGALASHILGYIGRISLAELKTLDIENYRSTEFIGKNGIEQFYEDKLHGKSGLRYIEVDAKSRPVRELERIPPVTGQDIVLSIDIELQRFAENLLGDRKGSIVAIDPRNGEVLALASTPTFDPNLFVGGMDHDTYQKLISDSSKPMFNRAIQSRYPPGSTIKPMMALIGLENNVIRPETRKFAGPVFEYMGVQYRDWKKGGHGWVDMNKAIAQSCDVYFYELALDLTIGRMSAGLAGFGFGEKTGIDLPAESSGVRPTPEWKRRVYKKPWYPGETVITGIGQGFMLATPLQLAQATAVVSMRGHSYPPHLLKNPENLTENPVYPTKNIRNWDHVIDAMMEVVHGATGTAKKIIPLIHNIEMAGKTGTAQVVGFAKDTTYNAASLPEHLRDHALFVGFAPAKNPNIAVAVMVENGGSGGGTASPLGGLVVDFWQKRLGKTQ